MAVIYGLFDPRKPLDWENCRYVGKTVQTPHRRLSGHRSTAHRGHNDPRDRWIRSLWNQDVEPQIEVLEQVADNLVDERERWWIAKGRQENLNLLNVMDGGDGRTPGATFTAEQRARLSRSVRDAHMRDPAIADRKRAGQARRYANPEERRRIGLAIAEGIAQTDQSDRWCDDCGTGPFRGLWGITAHQRYGHRFEPTHCTNCDAGPFAGAVGLHSHRYHAHTKKDAVMCACGSGPFVGERGLKIHQTRFCNGPPEAQ